MPKTVIRLLALSLIFVVTIALLALGESALAGDPVYLPLIRSDDSGPTATDHNRDPYPHGHAHGDADGHCYARAPATRCGFICGRRQHDRHRERYAHSIPTIPFGRPSPRPATGRASPLRPACTARTSASRTGRYIYLAGTWGLARPPTPAATAAISATATRRQHHPHSGRRNRFGGHADQCRRQHPGWIPDHRRHSQSCAGVFGCGRRALS